MRLELGAGALPTKVTGMLWVAVGSPGAASATVAVADSPPALVASER